MSREAEYERRMSVWAKVKQLSPERDGRGLTATQVNELRVFYGGRGIWRDKPATSVVSEDGYGITVGLLHTGKHYADDLDDQGGLYHYPHTKNAGTDTGDIEATKNCHRLSLPLFVITRPTPSSSLRNVNLGWVSGWDDGQGLFLVEYTEREPLAALHYERTEFVPIVKKQYRTTETKVRTGQQRFRFQVSTRYGMVCAASDVNVPQMLQAAHIVPDSEGGSMDPRNGLMLSANLHRAFDAGLWAIHPESFEIITNPSGPSRERLGIKHQDLNHLKKKPAKQALAEHWKKMKKAWDM